MNQTQTNCLHEHGFTRKTEPNPNTIMENVGETLRVTFKDSHVCRGCGETKSEILVVSGPFKAERVKREAVL